MNLENFSGKRFLADWKDIRNILPSNDSAIECVIEFWKKCPTVNRAIDPTNADSWPSAWELIDSGLICRYALALGMAYTLVYADSSWWERVELVFAHTDSDQTLLLIIDKHWVLNYSYGEKQDIEQVEFRAIDRFVFDGKRFNEKEATRSKNAGNNNVLPEHGKKLSEWQKGVPKGPNSAERRKMRRKEKEKEKA